jgi:hypothetical protein
VVAVTPSSVDVQSSRQRFRFDNDGKETDASRRDRLGFGPSPESKLDTVLWQLAPEFQSWEIEELSAEEFAAWKAKIGKGRLT